MNELNCKYCKDNRNFRPKKCKECGKVGALVYLCDGVETYIREGSDLDYLLD